MPAHPMFDDIKTVSVNLDSESRQQLVDLVKIEKSNKSAVIRRLISRAHADFLRQRLHQNQELMQEQVPA